MPHPLNKLRRTRIGTNKGTPRVWIEGRWVAAAGFTPGARYNVSPTADGGFIATLDQAGRLKVSKKTVKGELLPILDLRRPEQTPGQHLMIMVSDGEIRFTPELISE